MKADDKKDKTATAALVKTADTAAKALADSDAKLATLKEAYINYAGAKKNVGLIIFGCVAGAAVVGTAVWYFFFRNKESEGGE